jgi:hypothetical protein
MLWAGYNFWCSPAYDKFCDVDTLWASEKSPLYNKRSPEDFHQLIAAKNPVPNPFPFEVQPCQSGEDFYTSQLTNDLWAHVPRENTLVISNEELERSPEVVWRTVAAKTGLKPHQQEMSPDILQHFHEVRINTADHKGERQETSLNQYEPGSYAISGHKPMLEETRTLINRCWQNDCLSVSQLTGSRFAACADVNATIHGADADVKANAYAGANQVLDYIPNY